MSTTPGKTAVLRLLRHLPMPVIAILIGLLAGLAVWAVLEQIQSRQVKKIFDAELRTRLDTRARESLMRFDQYLASYAAAAQVLANDRLLAVYLAPILWLPQAHATPLVYRDAAPPWLLDLSPYFDRNGVVDPSHVLLVDRGGQPREIFQTGDLPLPSPLARGIEPHLRDAKEVRRVLLGIDEGVFLVVSDPVADLAGYPMGWLVVVVPVDQAFLADTQTGMPIGSAAVALVDGEAQRIRVSIDPAAVPHGSPLDARWEDYLITSQSLPQYDGSDVNLLLATFIPHDTLDKMSRHVRAFELRQRAIAAVVFITVFTLVIYLVSARLNKVLKRMSRFSERALGIAEPGFERGANQLIVLEEWMRQFTRLVLEARERMRRQHLRELREREALKAAIMEASLDSIVTLDRGGAIIEVNPTAEETLGYPRDTLIGRPFAELILPRHWHSGLATLLAACDADPADGSARHARGELRACTADGRELPVEVSIVPIAIEAKRFYTLYMHDISARLAAAREIEGLARFAAESPNPILRVSPAGVLVYANAAAAPLVTAWRLAEGLCLPPERVRDVARALTTGRNREREVELAGQVYSLVYTPIPGLGYVNIYGRDITAVRRAEQESRRHQSELVHVCRLSTMGEVATGMAHELNQPLAAIANYANGCIRRLTGGSAEPQGLIDALGQIASQAHRAGEIIRRLRALVGKQPPARAPVDLRALIREVCSFLEFESVKLGVTVELALPPEEIGVSVDLVQLEQVLLNLVKNALDALADRPAAQRRVRVRAWSDGGEARVAVEDSGEGIPAARLPRLFEPFYTTKEQGMGMGLAISRTIMDGHGGRIWAEASPLGGALFQVALPLVGHTQAAGA